jgi:hypothetical protein
MATSHYHHCRVQVPRRKASRRNKMWSSVSGLSRFLLASIIRPAALKRRSTAVLVAGGVKYLENEGRIRFELNVFG